MKNKLGAQIFFWKWEETHKKGKPLLPIVAKVIHLIKSIPNTRFFWKSDLMPKHMHITYRIVASTNTCYHSEKQIFYFLKVSNSNMPQFFLGKKLFCLLSKWAEKKDTWHDVFVKYPEYLRDQTTFNFGHPMLLIELVSISSMGCH